MPAHPMDLLNAEPDARGERTAAAAGVVVIDPRGDLAAAAGEALQRDRAGAVRAVADYLMALGDLATQGPARAIITAQSDLGDDPADRARTAEALHRLAPRAKLIVVASGDEPGEATGAFDVRIDRPADAQALVAALRDALTAGRLAAAPHVAPAEDGEGQAIDECPAETPHLGAVFDDLSVNCFEEKAVIPRGVESERPADAVPIEVQAEGHADATPRLIEPQGDTDLLDVLLGGGDLREPALAVLRAHCDVPQAALAEDESQAPAEHVRAAVAWGGDTFGLLHAPPPADAAKLADWADWLARWYALQHRQARLWRLAMHDDLTSAWNRRYFFRFLNHILLRAADERFFVTVLVFDIDDFKSYNDRFGHDAGDDILRESVKLLDSLVREHDVVARIGGDEFGVIFWDQNQPRQPNSRHPSDVRTIAARFQCALREHRFPKLGRDAPGTLTISGGLAGFPWDGRTADELLRRADQMALQSKREGKNAITIGPGALADADLADAEDK